MDWLSPYFDSNKPLANCNYNYIKRMAKPSNC